MLSRVMHLVALVCVHMSTKNKLFSALPFETLLLSVMRCLLFKFKCLKCGCYVQRVVQTSNSCFSK